MKTICVTPRIRIYDTLLDIEPLNIMLGSWEYAKTQAMAKQSPQMAVIPSLESLTNAYINTGKRAKMGVIDSYEFSHTCNANKTFYADFIENELQEQMGDKNVKVEHIDNICCHAKNIWSSLMDKHNLYRDELDVRTGKSEKLIVHPQYTDTSSEDFGAQIHKYLSRFTDEKLHNLLDKYYIDPNDKIEYLDNFVPRRSDVRRSFSIYRFTKN